MNNLMYVLVGVLWVLIFADAYLTLHGLSSGKLIEKNRLVRWFVKSPWRLYPLTTALCAGAFLAARIAVAWHWALGVAFLVPAIVQRVIVVRRNYTLNVKVL